MRSGCTVTSTIVGRWPAARAGKQERRRRPGRRRKRATAKGRSVTQRRSEMCEISLARPDESRSKHADVVRACSLRIVEEDQEEGRVLTVGAREGYEVKGRQTGEHTHAPHTQRLCHWQASPGRRS
eukprot:1320704-Rhodomonas_salina.1